MKYYLLLIILMSNVYLVADRGCMDRSKHGYLCNYGPKICCTKEYDNKSYFPVACSCPCWRYPHSWRRYRCLQCMHYHDPKDFEITIADEKELKPNKISTSDKSIIFW